MEEDYGWEDGVEYCIYSIVLAIYYGSVGSSRREDTINVHLESLPDRAGIA